MVGCWQAPMVFCGGGGRLSQPGHDAFRNLAQVDGARAVRRDFEGAQRARAADEAPRPAQPGVGHDSAPHGSYQTEDLSEPELRHLPVGSHREVEVRFVGRGGLVIHEPPESGESECWRSWHTLARRGRPKSCRKRCGAPKASCCVLWSDCWFGLLSYLRPWRE